MGRVVRVVVQAACAVVFAAPAPAQEDAEKPGWVLTLADGSALEAKFPRLDAKGFLPGGGAGRVPSGRLWRLERRPVEPACEPGGVIVRLQDGGRVVAEDLRFQDGKLACRWPLAESELVFAPGSVSGWRVGGSAADIETFARALAKPDAETDRVLAFDENGAVRVVSCTLLSMDGKEAKLDYREKSRALALAKLFGAVLRAPAAAPQASQANVFFDDGSAVPAREMTIANGVLKGALPGGAAITVPLDRTLRVEFRPPSLVYLSDLDPSAVRESVQLTRPFPWQRDRNTLRQPIRLGGTIHPRGIGMHAESALTFDLAGAYSRFAARVGLDALAGRAGNCVVRVLVDGKEKFRKEFLGESKPEDVAVDLKSARRLTLQVDPGPNFDIGDHVVWADARLLKE